MTECSCEETSCERYPVHGNYPTTDAAASHDSRIIGQWRAVVGWTGFYEVSDLGLVRSLDRVVTHPTCGKLTLRGKVLRQSNKRSSSGASYAVVTLRDSSTHRHCTVVVGHLVLESFVGPRPAGYECCHRDDDGHNNHLANLRWDTRQANIQDQVKNGRHASQIRSANGWGGERHPMARLTESDVRDIRQSAQSGVLQRELAQQFHTSQQHISQIIKRRAWPNVN